MEFKKVIRPNQGEISLVIKQTVARWIKRQESTASITETVLKVIYKEIIINKKKKAKCSYPGFMHWLKRKFHVSDPHGSVLQLVFANRDCR